jgi:hypothetical protein
VIGINNVQAIMGWLQGSTQNIKKLGVHTAYLGSVSSVGYQYQLKSLSLQIRGQPIIVRLLWSSSFIYTDRASLLGSLFFAEDRLSLHPNFNFSRQTSFTCIITCDLHASCVRHERLTCILIKHGKCEDRFDILTM